MTPTLQETRTVLQSAGITLQRDDAPSVLHIHIPPISVIGASVTPVMSWHVQLNPDEPHRCTALPLCSYFSAEFEFLQLAPRGRITAMRISPRQTRQMNSRWDHLRDPQMLERLQSAVVLLSSETEAPWTMHDRKLLGLTASLVIELDRPVIWSYQLQQSPPTNNSTSIQLTL